jgi:hypothetical protein
LTIFANTTQQLLQLLPVFSCQRTNTREPTIREFTGINGQ